MLKPDTLIEVCSRILRFHGLTDEAARITAESLVEADLRGVSGHGVIRLPIYVERFRRGKINARPDIRIARETASTAVLDGDNGMGQFVSQKAMDLVLQKAAQANIAAVAVRHSNHFGAGAFWAMQALRHDMIGIALSNVEPLMAPPGGAEARVGNNPIAVAVPAGSQPPIVLDMATSVVPLGKILSAKSKGESIPPGWAVNAAGEQTTDPDEAIHGGSLFPVGGPKGYGLAVIVDLLTAVLSQGAFGGEIGSLYKDLTRSNDISHFFMAIRIDAFMDPERFKATVDRYIRYLKQTPVAAGVPQIYLPGEIEHSAKTRNLGQGIALPDSTVQSLTELAAQANLPTGLIRQLFHETNGKKE